MNGYASVVRKEFMHLRRDATTLIIAMMLPMIQLVLFGYAIDFDVRHIPTVVADLDHSAASRAYIQKLQASQYLDIVSSVTSPTEASDQLRSGAARVGVIIPPTFERESSAGGNPQVGVLLDGSDAQVSVRARSAFVEPPSNPVPGSPEARMSVLYNPTGRTANYMIPGLIAVILQIVTVSLTAFSIVREKEQGSLEQLIVTPIGRLALMLGKLTPYAVLATAELLVVVFLGNVVFDVHSRGSLLLLGIMSVPFIVASLGLGLVISTVAQTQGQALQFTMLTVMPSILLSGYVSPRETMPGWLWVISNGVPATHYVAITRGIMVRGASFADLAGPLLALVGLATTLIVVATTRFRKSIA